MVAFAKAKKIRRPVRPAVVESEDRAASPSRQRNKGAECTDADCDRSATAKGMCSMHYTRAYRSSDKKMEKAREASRRYAARKRAEREARR